VELEIDPEPTPEERAAIELALEQLFGDGAATTAYTSRWRQAGITENVELGPTAYATARPRSRPGATRA
jgi:hypothetical protein